LHADGRVVNAGFFAVGTDADGISDLPTSMARNPSMRWRALHRGADVVVKRWTEPEYFAWNGRFNRPSASQHAGAGRCTSRTPPIWIPAAARSETMAGVQRTHVYC